MKHLTVNFEIDDGTYKFKKEWYVSDKILDKDKYDKFIEMFNAYAKEAYEIGRFIYKKNKN